MGVVPGIYTKVDITQPDLPWYIESKLVANLQSRKDIGKSVPDFMIRDIFKYYFNVELRYVIPPSMMWWQKILAGSGNYLLKTITEGRLGYSYLATLHILRSLSATLKKTRGWKSLNNKRNNEIKRMVKWMKQLQRAKDLDNKRKAKGLKPIHIAKLSPKPDQNVLNSEEYQEFLKGIKSALKEGTTEAQEQIGKLQQVEGMEGGQNGAGDYSPEDIDKYVDSGKLDAGFPLKQLESFIKQSIRRFKHSSVGKQVKKEESIFEAEEILDITTYEDFSHVALIMNAMADSIYKNFYFNLYIDISGSMDSNTVDASVWNNGGRHHHHRSSNQGAASCLQLAKALARKFISMNMVKTAYVFNNRITPVKPNEINMIHVAGGTDIDKVMRHAKDAGLPALIITDCEDSWDTYNDHSFILSVSQSISACDALKRSIRMKNVSCYYNGNLATPKQLNERESRLLDDYIYSYGDDNFSHPAYISDGVQFIQNRTDEE